MNYSMDNKIWRVGGPLFAYFGINFTVKLCFHLGLFYAQFKELNVNAAFNGILYSEQLNEKEQVYAVLIAGLAAVISIPIFYILMKKDYEYPVNRRHKEKNFDITLYVRNFDREMLPMFILIGVFATLGLSRLILMLPIDGILGDYTSIKETYEAGSVWIQIIMLGIVTPIAEELLFRGIVYNRLKIYYDVTIAGYISAIIFGVVHFNLLQGIYAFIMGIIFAYVYQKSNNICAPMVIHVAANLVAVLSSVSPVALWMEKHIIIKLVVAVIETGVFLQLISMLCKRLEKKAKESKKAEEDMIKEQEVSKQTHKIDFHI